MSEEYDELVPIRQLKLSNGDEIICKLQDVKDIDSTKQWIPVKDALTMFLYDDAFEDELVTRYAFKPWMSLQDDVTVSIDVKSANIIACYTPSNPIIGKYLEIIDTPPIVLNQEEDAPAKKPALKVVPFVKKDDQDTMD